MSQTNFRPKKELLKDWKKLIEKAGAPEIAEGKQAICAKIFENQRKDSLTESAYRDEELIKAFGGHFVENETQVNEAEVAGDHGYDPMNIAAGKSSGAITNIGPSVMGMVRRSIPNLLAFNVAGVQPMATSTGQIFSLRAVYGKDPLAADAKEAFHPMYAPNAMASGLGSTKKFDKITPGIAIAVGEIYHHEFVETGTAFLQATAAVTLATTTNEKELDDEVIKQMDAGVLVEIAEGMATSIAELQENFNGSQNNPWEEMAFRIDKQVIEAKSRQLKSQYSIEVAQDLRAHHGMDADSELSGVLANEIMLEIDREMIDWINYSAQVGKSGVTLTAGSKAGVFDFQDPIDTRGARWAGESFKALLYQIDKEAAEIGRQTGRGSGNFIIASRNIVNILASVDQSVSPAAQGLARGLNSDTSKGLFAGVLGGRYNVYIDQYARQDYFVVGYKGVNELDAGIYYAPYVALTPLRGQDPKNFQPVLGFKTRYGVGVNPFADTYAQQPAGNGRITNGMPGILGSIGKNGYFRRVLVKGA